MKIPVGRIIRVDMGADKWGTVLYMVVQPPIVCEHCDTVVFEWRESEGDVVCPECGKVIRDRFYYPCPYCHGDDYHTLRVVNNQNWHYDSTRGEVTDYNDKKGAVLNVCGRSIERDIAAHRMRLMSGDESQDIKRKILWTGSDDYDSSKPMPQWIVDRFPHGGQK